MILVDPELAVQFISRHRCEIDATLPNDYDFDVLMNKLHIKISTLFVDVKTMTMFVLEPITPTTLLVDMVFSRTEGALKRELPLLQELAVLANVQKLICTPGSAAHERLYKRYGWSAANDEGYCEMKIENVGAKH